MLFNEEKKNNFLFWFLYRSTFLSTATFLFKFLMFSVFFSLICVCVSKPKCISPLFEQNKKKLFNRKFYLKTLKKWGKWERWGGIRKFSAAGIILENANTNNITVKRKLSIVLTWIGNTEKVFYNTKNLLEEEEREEETEGTFFLFAFLTWIWKTKEYSCKESFSGENQNWFSNRFVMVLRPFYSSFIYGFFFGCRLVTC